MKILLVDDSHEVLDVLFRILAGEGVQADRMDNAAGAVEALSKARYDLIFLDVRMPGKDGLWFLRHAAIPASTAVVMMSAWRTPGLLDNLPALGVAEFLEKPFGISAITRILRRYEHHNAA